MQSCTFNFAMMMALPPIAALQIGLLLLLQPCACRRLLEHFDLDPEYGHDPLLYHDNATFAMEVVTVSGQPPQFVTVQLHRDWAPLGFERWTDLVKASFFDESRFFRVVPGFIAQWGIAADPRDDAEWRDSSLPDDPVRASNMRGAVAFGQTGQPNTRATQLFVNLGNNGFLDNKGFAPIGLISEQDMKILDGVYAGYLEKPDQRDIHASGNDGYLKQKFPKLSYVVNVKCKTGCPNQDWRAQGLEAGKGLAALGDRPHEAQLPVRGIPLGAKQPQGEVELEGAAKAGWRRDADDPDPYMDAYRKGFNLHGAHHPQAHRRMHRPGEGVVPARDGDVTTYT